MAREGKAKVLSEAEFKRLLIVSKNNPMAVRNLAMIFCSFGLGLRSKEIASLSIVNGDTKARINGAGFEPLIAAGASKIGLGSHASMRAYV